MNIVVLLVCVLHVLVVNSEKKKFDPNAVSHTTKSELLKSLEAANEEILVYFCKRNNFNISHIFCFFVQFRSEQTS